MLIDTTRVKQRVQLTALSATHLGEHLRVALPAFAVAIPSISIRFPSPVGIHRLTAVAPPGIEALTEKLIIDLSPIHVASLSAEDIVARVLQHQSCLAELTLLRTVHRVGPHRYHQVRIQRMHRVGQPLRVRIVAAVHLRISPSLGPVAPVLHDHVDGDLSLAKLVQVAHYVVLTHIARATLHVTRHISGQHGRIARQQAVLCHHLVH